jgi:preprotein translocase subunit SecD
MKKRYRFFIILLIVGICLVFLYPTVRWYFFVPRDEQNLALGSREQIRDYARRTAGLDMQRLIEASRDNGELPGDLVFLVPFARAENKKNGEADPESWNAREVVRAINRRRAGESDTRAQIQGLIETRYRDQVFGLKNLQQNAVQLGLDLSGGLSIVLQGDMEALDAKFQEQYERNPTDAEREVIFDQALDVLNSRIDRFGLTEPVIRKQGTDQIYVEIPGTADPERIYDIIRGKGGLSFHIVDYAATAQFDSYVRQYPGFSPNEDGTLPIQGVVPDDVLILGVYEKDRYGIDEWKRYAAVKKEAGLDGNQIRDVFVQRNQDSAKPMVTFSLDAAGGDIFFEFTSDHINEPMAIVLDNRVKSIATINEGIHSRVAIKIGRAHV